MVRDHSISQTKQFQADNVNKKLTRWQNTSPRISQEDNVQVQEVVLLSIHISLQTQQKKSTGIQQAEC